MRFQNHERSSNPCKEKTLQDDEELQWYVSLSAIDMMIKNKQMFVVAIVTEAPAVKYSLFLSLL